MVREARAQARITHPNVAHIYFIGEEAGRLYFAMEHLAGKTLADADRPQGRSPSRKRSRSIRCRRARPARGPAHGITPPRHQAVEPDGRRPRHGQGPRLRARRRRAGRARTSRRPGRPDLARRHAALHGARAGARRRRSTSAPMSMRSARRCFTWSPGGRRSRPRPSKRCCPSTRAPCGRRCLAAVASRAPRSPRSTPCAAG